MRSTRYLVLGVSFLFLIVAGCASAPEKAPPKISGVFFPPPPDPPRIQYLRSFTSNQDIEPESSKFEKFVTGEQEKIKRLDKPYGVAVYDGKIYVCDSNYSVMVFDLKNKKFHSLEGAKGMGKPIQPLNISIDGEGNKYVSDPIRGQVLIYDRKDFFVRAFGSPMEWVPTDAVPFGDRLYVIDKRSNEIWVLDKTTGSVLDKIGKKEADKTKWLGRPTNLAFSQDGNLYVSDAGRFQVVKLDRDGHFLGTIGSLGTSPGRFSRPKGIAVDHSGRVYVVDAAFDNVQVFTSSGRLLMFFGRPGNQPGDFFLPAAITLDYNNIPYFSDNIDPNFTPKALIVVTSQFGARLVNVLALGQEKGIKYPTDEELLKQLDEMKKKVEEKEKAEEKAREKKSEGSKKDQGQKIQENKIQVK